MAKAKVLNKKQMGDSLGEQKTIIKRDDQGLDYMEEMHEDLVQEEHDTQHTLSQLTNAHSTHEECNFSSQPQQNLRSMHEVEVQDGNSPNMHKKESMMMLEDDEKIDQPTPSPLYEKEDDENFEKREEGIACDDEPKVEAFEELEKGMETLEDECPKEVSTIGPPFNKPSEPPKSVLEPLPSGLQYTFLRNN